MLRAILTVLLFLPSGHCFPFADGNPNEPNQLLTRIIATANVSANSSNGADSFQTAPTVRAVCTSISVLALILAVSTYWILIQYATPMSRGILLPWSAIEKLVFEVLSHSWIQDVGEDLSQPHLAGSILVSEIQKPRVLCAFRLEEWQALKTELVSGLVTIKAQRALGVEESDQTVPPDDPNETPRVQMIPMEVGSSAPKHLVQLTIWEAVSFWLACLMVINTVVYNGFATGHRSSDGNLRLFLVATYAFLQVLFSCYTTQLHGKTYGCVVGQACWVVLTNLFAFSNPDVYDYWLRQGMEWNGVTITLSKYDGEAPEIHNADYGGRGLILKRFRMVLFGECTVAETLGSVFTNCNPRLGFQTRLVAQGQNGEDLANVSRGHNGKAYFKTVQLEESATEKTIKLTRESETKSLEKVLETGLEKTLVHVGVLLGILLSTGIAPYTSVEFEKSNAVQLGSYALLLAVATGITALFSSLTSIISAQHSMELLLRLQEHLITIPEAVPPDHHFNPYDLLRHGLSDRKLLQDFENTTDISLSDIVRDTRGLRRWGCLVFGRGLAFLPTKQQIWTGQETYWSRPLGSDHTGTVQFSTNGDILRHEKVAIKQLVRNVLVTKYHGAPRGTRVDANPNQTYQEEVHAYGREEHIRRGIKAPRSWHGNEAHAKEPNEQSANGGQEGYEMTDLKPWKAG